VFVRVVVASKVRFALRRLRASRQRQRAVRAVAKRGEE
jgi:hypothetical protein